MQKIKQLTRIGIIIIGILLFFSNCEEHEIINQTEIKQNNKNGYILTRVNKNEISNNSTLVKKINEVNEKKGSIVNYSTRFENIQFNLNLNEAAYIESYDGTYHSYTFYINNEDNSFDINNIVLVSYNNGVNYEAYLSSYSLTELERNQFINGVDINLEQKASIEPFDINQINTYSRVGGGCYDLVFVEYQDCSCHDVHAEGGCTHPEAIYEWQEVACPGGGGAGGDGSGTGTGTGGTGGGGTSGSGDDTSETIPTTPMYPDGTSAAPDFLINAFGGEGQLTLEQLNWIENIANDNSVNLILNYLSQNNNNQPSILFALELINLNPKDSNAVGFLLQAKQQDKMYSELDDLFLQSVNQYLAIDTSTIDPIVMAQLRTYFTVKCAVLRHNHPYWSDLKIYWEASKDLVHITLDAFGMIPIGGEIADLTNGVLYLIEGDGVNASLSFAATIPIGGWAATGAKYAIKIVDTTQTASTIATKVKLTWKVVGTSIDFGNRGQLRKVLGIAVGNPNQAHHIIPWAKRGHPAVQKAAKSSNAFHMNEALNGVPLTTAVHNGSHANYDNLVQIRLNNIDLNQTPNEVYDEVLDIINDIRTAILNNPTTPLNQLTF